MKKVVFFLTLSLNFSLAQELVINLDNGVQNQEIIVEKGKYSLKIINITKVQILEFKMSRGVNEFESLSIQRDSADLGSESLNKIDRLGNEEKITLDFKDNTVYTFLVKIKDENEIQDRKFVFSSQSGWDWTSTFGVNAIFLLKSDSYKTIASDDQFQIVGDSGQNIIEYVPSVMFTFMDRSKNVSLGVSGGLGFDLEQISVFAGGSLAFGQNFIVTAGIAFHNQQRLDSRYRANDLVDTALSFDDLHERYYRFNPFLSLSLRLDSSPFKSGD